MRQLFQRLYDTSTIWANRWRCLRQYTMRSRSPMQTAIRHERTIHRSLRAFALLSLTGLVGKTPVPSNSITTDPRSWQVIESADAHAHPSVSSLRVLRACDIDDVLSSGRPVVVYVYRSDCSACACYTPIIEAFAHSISGVGVYAINDETDFHPKLSALATHKLPAVALFTSQSAADALNGSHTEAAPAIYEGAPNVTALVHFVHSKAPTSFDIDAALAAAKRSAALTAKRVHDAAQKRISEGIVSQLYANSPCGTLMISYMTEMLAAMYSDQQPVEPRENTSHSPRTPSDVSAADRVDSLHSEFRQCIDRHKRESMEYWQTLYVVAEDNINKLQPNRR